MRVGSHTFLMVIAVSVTFAVMAIVVPFLSAMVIPVVPMFVITVIASTFLMSRYIFALVPVVSHKINRFATGVVLPTVLAPVLHMARRNMQIDGRAAYGYSLDITRLRVDELRRRKAANIESTIEAGLADAHCDPNIGGECGSADGGNKSHCHQETFHGFTFVC